MRCIKLNGTSYLQGYRHGLEFKSLLPYAMETSKRYCSQFMSNNSYMKTRELMVSSLKDRYPYLLEEMSGISEGSGVPFDDVLNHNLYWDLFCACRGCTAVAIKSEDGGVIVGKTTDTGDEAEFYMLKYVDPENGNKYIGIGMIGAVWVELGLNDEGLVVTQNSAPFSSAQSGHPGVPTMFMPGHLLAYCTSLEEAAAHIKETDCMGVGFNMIISDDGHRPVVAEKSSNKAAFRECRDGSVFCTNHFVEKCMEEFGVFPVESLLSNSRGRYDMLAEIFNKGDGHRNVDFVKEILGFHGREHSICQHLGKSAELDTKFGYIIKPDENLFLISEGKPCNSKFINYC